MMFRDLEPLEAAAKEWLLLFMAVSELIPICVTVVDVTVAEQVQRWLGATAGADALPQPLVYVNKKFEDTTGYSRQVAPVASRLPHASVQDVLGSNCRFLQHSASPVEPELAKAIRAQVWDMLPSIATERLAVGGAGHPNYTGGATR
jgi:hypothetical protein